MNQTVNVVVVNVFAVAHSLVLRAILMLPAVLLAEQVV
jgi:hypothetical protein